MQTDRTEPVPAGHAPIFIAGADRSGTTLLYALLASHPEISMVRRTNMWRYFYRRYGDLDDPANLDRCLDDMVRFNRMRHLQPDRERIRREFLAGEHTYGHLFSLFHEHNAQRAGKPRWGDKSLHTEQYVEQVVTEFPDARIVHIVRDPRDRYASVRKRYGQDLSRVGAATGRWLRSTRAARRNTRRHPDNSIVVRYEDLARDPAAVMERVCAHLRVEFSPSLLAMEGAPEHRGGGNSSFGDLEPGAISTRAIGRYREVLRPTEIAFIELVARRELAALGYERSGVSLSFRERLRFWCWEVPVAWSRMQVWCALERRQIRRGERIPPFRLVTPEAREAAA